MLARSDLHSKKSYSNGSRNSSRTNGNHGEYDSNHINGVSTLELSPPSQKNPLRDDSECRPDNNLETSAAVTRPEEEEDASAACTEEDIAAQLEDEVMFLVRQHNPGKESEMLDYMEK